MFRNSDQPEQQVVDQAVIEDRAHSYFRIYLPVLVYICVIPACAALMHLFDMPNHRGFVATVSAIDWPKSIAFMVLSSIPFGILLGTLAHAIARRRLQNGLSTPFLLSLICSFYAFVSPLLITGGFYLAARLLGITLHTYALLFVVYGIAAAILGAVFGYIFGQFFGRMLQVEFTR